MFPMGTNVIRVCGAKSRESIDSLWLYLFTRDHSLRSIVWRSIKSCHAFSEEAMAHFKMKSIKWKKQRQSNLPWGCFPPKKFYEHENGKFLEHCHLFLFCLGKNNNKMNNQSLSLSKPMSVIVDGYNLNLSNCIRQRSNLRQADLALPACAEGKLQHWRNQL